MSKVSLAEQFVRKRIANLEKIPDLGKQKVMLAELRRGVGRMPGELPQLWGLLFRELPEDMMGGTDGPSREEWAIYTALTLYALHQQGRDPAHESMNCPDRGIGCAAAMLVEDDENDLKRVQNRFNRFALASDIPEAVTYLRSLVDLLRSKSIGLDYARLAGDLYRYQFYESAQSIRLTWGQDFYRKLNEKHKEGTENE